MTCSQGSWRHLHSLMVLPLGNLMRWRPLHDGQRISSWKTGYRGVALSKTFTPRLSRHAGMDSPACTTWAPSMSLTATERAMAVSTQNSTSPAKYPAWDRNGCGSLRSPCSLPPQVRASSELCQHILTNSETSTSSQFCDCSGRPIKFGMNWNGLNEISGRISACQRSHHDERGRLGNQQSGTHQSQESRPCPPIRATVEWR